MLTSIIFISLISSKAVLAVPTATVDDGLEVRRRDPSWLSTKRPFGWGPSWGGVAVGGAVAGAAVGGTVNSIWQGLKSVLSPGSNYDGGQSADDSNIIVVPYPYPAPYQSNNGYAPTYPQNQNGPQWQNSPPSQNGPQWQNAQPVHQEQQNQPAQQEQQNQQTETQETKKTTPSAGMSITLSSPVVCRKFPDTITSTTLILDTYAGGSKVFVNCWTTASMTGEAGRVENSPIWLMTDRGCYVSDTVADESTDFQARLPFCVAPVHWAATVQKQYEAKLDCYQCPTLKCPNFTIGKSKTVDVQCLVDGEDARGNNTWAKPIDQNCYLPAEIFTKQGWMGTTGGKC